MFVYNIIKKEETYFKSFFEITPKVIREWREISFSNNANNSIGFDVDIRNHIVACMNSL